MRAYLQHYGIPGMHWHVRRFQDDNGRLTEAGKERYKEKTESTDKKMSKNSEVSYKGSTKRDVSQISGENTRSVYEREDGTKDMNRLQKDARKDAEDMARAKAYYGEGAGTRRKQIKNRISERMKDPDYKAEYEKHLASQDMSAHQKAANRERKLTDTKNTVAKVGRGIKNLALGLGTTSMTAITLWNAAKVVGLDTKMADWGRTALNKLRTPRY